MAKTHDMRDGRSPSPSSTRTLEPEPDSSPAGRGNADSRYVALAELQRLAGNRATSRLIGTRAVQRDAAVATPEAPPGGGPASPGTAGAPGPGGAAAPPPGRERRILDRASNAPIVVDEAQWKAEGQHLVKRVKSALKLIPEDSKEVLDEYPLAEVRDMYAACMAAVGEAIEALRMGALVEASRQMHIADQWTGIEIKAHKLLMDMGVLKYVGGQLDHAVIGFFQGAADTLLGLVDGAASLYDVDTGLVAWNDKQYHQIQEAYTGVSGIDIDHVMAGSIGKMGGQLAVGLATFETLGGAGDAGKVVMGVEATAGVKSVGEKVVKMRTDGKSWSAIFGDPSFLAECAGAIAGAAGAGASFGGPLSAFLKEAGMIASEAQIAASVDAIVDVQLDKSLSAQARSEKTVQLLGQGLQTLAAVADGAARGGGPEPRGGAEAGGAGERTSTGEAAPTEPGPTPREPIAAGGEREAGKPAASTDEGAAAALVGMLADMVRAGGFGVPERPAGGGEPARAAPEPQAPAAEPAPVAEPAPAAEPAAAAAPGTLRGGNINELRAAARTDPALARSLAAERTAIVDAAKAPVEGEFGMRASDVGSKGTILSDADMTMIPVEQVSTVEQPRPLGEQVRASSRAAEALTESLRAELGGDPALVADVNVLSFRGEFARSEPTPQTPAERAGAAKLEMELGFAAQMREGTNPADLRAAFESRLGAEPGEAGPEAEANAAALDHLEAGIAGGEKFVNDRALELETAQQSPELAGIPEAERQAAAVRRVLAAKQERLAELFDQAQRAGAGSAGVALEIYRTQAEIRWFAEGAYVVRASYEQVVRFSQARRGESPGGNSPVVKPTDLMENMAAEAEGDERFDRSGDYAGAAAEQSAKAGHATDAKGALKYTARAFDLLSTATRSSVTEPAAVVAAITAMRWARRGEAIGSAWSDHELAPAPGGGPARDTSPTRAAFEAWAEAKGYGELDDARAAELEPQFIEELQTAAADVSSDLMVWYAQDAALAEPAGGAAGPEEPGPAGAGPGGPAPAEPAPGRPGPSRNLDDPAYRAELANDPEGGRPRPGEADDVIELMKSGELPNSMRRANGKLHHAEDGADFVDEVTGQLWDHKYADPRGQRFDDAGVDEFLGKIEVRDIPNGEKILLNTRRLTDAAARQRLLAAIVKRGLTKEFLLIPREPWPT